MFQRGIIGLAKFLASKDGFSGNDIAYALKIKGCSNNLVSIAMDEAGYKLILNIKPFENFLRKKNLSEKDIKIAIDMNPEFEMVWIRK